MLGFLTGIIFLRLKDSGDNVFIDRYVRTTYAIDDMLVDNLVYAAGLGQFSSPLYAIYFLPLLDWNYSLKNDCYSCKDM